MCMIDKEGALENGWESREGIDHVRTVRGTDTKWFVGSRVTPVVLVVAVDSQDLIDQRVLIHVVSLLRGNSTPPNLPRRTR